MIPKGALIGLGTGIICAMIFGLFLSDLTNRPPSLVYVDGPSLSIITEKTNFELGEDIHIKIINSGTMPLTFSDSYAIKIIGLDGSILYSPMSKQMTVLQPKEEKLFVWDQTKSNDEKIIEGRYKIISRATSDEKIVEKSLIINILK